jgi:tetratricopeptide (TPR) repeat protein
MSSLVRLTAVAVLLSASAGSICAQEKLAGENWMVVRSEPFQVFTNAGEKAGQELLGDLLQFRHTLATLTGANDLQPLWPVRVVLFKSPKDAAAYAPEGFLARSRGFWYAAVAGKDPVSGDLLRPLATVLLNTSGGRIPADFRRGLITLVSTLQLDRTRITLGAPPPPPERTPEWARVHMLAVDSQYYGKLRILIRNLENMTAEGPAYRNTIGKEPAAIEKEAAQYLAQGAFETTSISALALNPLKQLYPESIDRDMAQTILADLLAAHPQRLGQAHRAYASVGGGGVNPDAEEGLGLLALREGNREQAKQHFAKAAEANSLSPIPYFEYARLLTEHHEAVAMLEKAAEANKRWPEPLVEFAKRTESLPTRAEAMERAARRDPGDPELWKAAAEAHIAAQQYPQAAKAWSEAIRSAQDKQQRAEFEKARLDVDRQRIEAEEATRKAKLDAERAEIQRLRDQATARIRAYEAKVNANDTLDPNQKVEMLWAGKAPNARVKGTLTKIECSGKAFVLPVEQEDKAVIRLLVNDPLQVLLTGREFLFQCNAPINRPATIEYFKAADAKLGTAGEAATVNLQ